MVHLIGTTEYIMMNGFLEGRSENMLCPHLFLNDILSPTSQSCLAFHSVFPEQLRTTSYFRRGPAAFLKFPDTLNCGRWVFREWNPTAAFVLELYLQGAALQQQCASSNTWLHVASLEISHGHCKNCDVFVFPLISDTSGDGSEGGEHETNECYLLFWLYPLQTFYLP